MSLKTPLLYQSEKFPAAVANLPVPQGPIVAPVPYIKAGDALSIVKAADFILLLGTDFPKVIPERLDVVA